MGVSFSAAGAESQLRNSSATSVWLIKRRYLFFAAFFLAAFFEPGRFRPPPPPPGSSGLPAKRMVEGKVILVSPFCLS
jgi:hypothetical protein